jgi:hypothetical protein
MGSSLRFLSLLFVALALAPSMAHLLELPNKIHLSRDEYLTVQQIYRGWALLGIVVVVALLSTLTFTIMARHEPKVFALALIGPTSKPITVPSCRTTGSRFVCNGNIPMPPARG